MNIFIFCLAFIAAGNTKGDLTRGSCVPLTSTASSLDRKTLRGPKTIAELNGAEALQTIINKL